MRRKTLLCTCLCLFFLYHLSFAQISDASLLYDASISPSAGAGGLAQMAASPVNLSNGKANITVPLVSLPSYAMQLPVSLSYQTGGIRVNDVAGQVGLGWTLNSGGVITRIVRGRPDDEALTPIPPGTTNPQGNGYAGSNYQWIGRGGLVKEIAEERAEITGNVEAINKYAKGEWDSEPDIFYFNFMGYSGRFVLNENHKPVLIPHQDIKINLIFAYISNNSYPEINDLRFATWVLTTPDGSSYVFGNPHPVVANANQPSERAIERTLQTISKPFVNSPCFPNGTETIGEFASSWYLKEVISPQGNVELTFKYAQAGPVTYTNVTDITYKKIYSTSTEPPCADAIPTNTALFIRTTTRISNPLYVQEIVSPKGKLEFTYDGNRSDLVNGKRLTGVLLKNPAGQTVKSIYLRYGVFNNKAPMLHLVGENNLPPHEFFYNQDAHLPLRNSDEIDYWGYYNGAPYNVNAIPGYIFNKDFGDLPADQNGWCPCRETGADRTPSLAQTKADMLVGIKFPSGGQIEYSYESNEYFDGTQNRPWGGVRVKTVTTYESSNAKKSVVNYSYLNHTPAPEGNPISNQSSGTIDPGFKAVEDLKFYRWFRMYEKQGSLSPMHKTEFLVRSSQAANAQQLISGDPLVYKCVAVTQEGMGRTIHRFTSFADHPEKVASRFQYFGSLSRSYTGADGQPLNAPNMPNSSRSWERGLPTHVEVYAQNGQIKSWKQLDYEFNPSHPAENVYGLVVNTNYSGVTSDGTAGGDMYGFYTEEPLWVHLKQVTERVYDQNDATKFAQASSFYEYSPVNLRVVKETQQTGEEAVVQVIYKYPHDYAYLAQQAADGTPLDINKMQHASQDYKAVVNEMQRRHMSGYVIEKQVWRQKTANEGLYLLSAELSRFKVVDKPQGYLHMAYSLNWPSYTYHNYYKKYTMILPYQGLQLHTASPLGNYTPAGLNADGNLVYADQFTVESTVDAYNDLGQVLETHGKDDIPSAMLWSKAGGLPIASAVNAHHHQIAFTSFESYGDAGNWSFAEADAQPGDAKTGRQSFAGAVESNVLTAGRYKVSGWYKGGSVIINTATTFPAANAWTYFEHVLTDPATVKVETSGDGARLDELRLHPVGARMNTSTYQELVGPNDQSDLNSRTAYAEYDGDKRLQLVKDNQGDIVKYYRYHYHNQEGPRWEYTGNKTCVLDLNGPTGYQNQEQRDENPASASYGNLRTVTVSNAADCEPCRGESKKWSGDDIEGECLEGEKKYINSYQSGEYWVCEYKYFFADGTSSATYSESQSGPCPIE